MAMKSTNLYTRIKPDLKLVTLSPKKPLTVSDLSQKELDNELEKGYQDMLAGRTKPADQVFADIRKDYNL